MASGWEPSEYTVALETSGADGSRSPSPPVQQAEDDVGVSGDHTARLPVRPQASSLSPDAIPASIAPAPPASTSPAAAAPCEASASAGATSSEQANVFPAAGEHLPAQQLRNTYADLMLQDVLSISQELDKSAELRSSLAREELAHTSALSQRCVPRAGAHPHIGPCLSQVQPCSHLCMHVLR